MRKRQEKDVMKRGQINCLMLHFFKSRVVDMVFSKGVCLGGDLKKQSEGLQRVRSKKEGKPIKGVLFIC